VKFIGVDLAWGEGKRTGTGLCAMTTEGVVGSCRLQTLDEIVEWMTPHTTNDCLVAIDAPLIIRNPGGQRPCEGLISRCFGRYEAGTHSSNLTKPWFRSGGRAKELVERLGLDNDPYFAPRSAVRSAIEVYPHPALVALFDLPLSLKYKGKGGRTREQRQQEFAKLNSLMESLSTHPLPAIDVQRSPRWADLKREIDDAPSGAALDRSEDELDAYVCAYIALYYWTHGHDRCRVVGDIATGYIVTPVSNEQGDCLDQAARDLEAASLRTSPPHRTHE
jgi:predicted RNase H-like nuclease